MDTCRCTTGCKQSVQHPEVTGDLCGQCYAHGCDSFPSDDEAPQDFGDDYDSFRNQMRGIDR